MSNVWHRCEVAPHSFDLIMHSGCSRIPFPPQLTRMDIQIHHGAIVRELLVARTVRPARTVWCRITDIDWHNRLITVVKA